MSVCSMLTRVVTPVREAKDKTRDDVRRRMIRLEVKGRYVVRICRTFHTNFYSVVTECNFWQFFSLNSGVLLSPISSVCWSRIFACHLVCVTCIISAYGPYMNKYEELHESPNILCNSARYVEIVVVSIWCFTEWIPPDLCKCLHESVNWWSCAPLKFSDFCSPHTV